MPCLRLLDRSDTVRHRRREVSVITERGSKLLQSVQRLRGTIHHGSGARISNRLHRRVEPSDRRRRLRTSVVRTIRGVNSKLRQRDRRVSSNLRVSNHTRPQRRVRVRTLKVTTSRTRRSTRRRASTAGGVSPLRASPHPQLHQRSVEVHLPDHRVRRRNGQRLHRSVQQGVLRKINVREKRDRCHNNS